MQAYLRDVSADSQTHPIAAVPQGLLGVIWVIVSNNGDGARGIPETFNVTLSVMGPATGDVDTRLVVDLAPGASAPLLLFWDTTAWPLGTYQITAHADSSAAITEFDEANNYCDAPTPLRIMGPPTADADGPYTGAEGAAILFDATASGDPDGAIVLYKWDWDKDGASTRLTVDGPPLRAPTA